MTNLLKQTISNTLNRCTKEEITIAMQRLTQNITNGEYAFFDIVQNPEPFLKTLNKIAANLKSKFSQFVVLGTGGSSLGGQTLCALKQYPGYHSPVLFLDNVDPTTFDLFLTSIDFKNTCFIVISKSGATSETLCQFLCLVEYFKKMGVSDQDLSSHFIIITEDKPSLLNQLAVKLDINCHEHPLKIGGRFSAFSIVALLPALLAGIDIKALLTGAREYLDVGAANVIDGVSFQYQHLKSGHNISVMMPYLDQLKSFSAWYAQLWAESLGKEGHGSTPVPALGTVDQHSQLQLYRDGPQDKTFTFIHTTTRDKGLPMGSLTTVSPFLEYMQGQCMGDLLEAELYATSTSLTHKGPVRLIEIKACDASSLGALLTHFILETILMAEILNVNAFDQPGVEESKVLTRKFLSEQNIL